jgi:hypothetical protein
MFFVRQLEQNYGVRNRIVIFSFAITFALSCTMFELIIFEILAFLEPTYVLFFIIILNIYSIDLDHAIFIGVLAFIVYFLSLSLLFHFILRIYY